MAGAKQTIVWQVGEQRVAVATNGPAIGKPLPGLFRATGPVTNVFASSHFSLHRCGVGAAALVHGLRSLWGLGGAIQNHALVGAFWQRQK
jgi:hypothetical protein